MLLKQFQDSVKGQGGFAFRSISYEITHERRSKRSPGGGARGGGGLGKYREEIRVLASGKEGGKESTCYSEKESRCRGGKSVFLWRLVQRNISLLRDDKAIAGKS